MVRGLSGRILYYALNNGMRVICYGRSIDNIRAKFGDSVIPTTAFEHTGIDYIIHAACPTSSNEMSVNPIGVIDAIYELTKSSLDLAKRNDARYVFLSSMEVYDNLSGLVDESMVGGFDLAKSRSSYPVGKQLAELMVNSYHNEYGTDTCVLRLSQMFGPGIRYDDTRFFNFAIKKCLHNDPIVLNSTGEKWHNSCYIDDAVYYIMNIMSSETNNTFNITNELYCDSINNLTTTIIQILNSSSTLSYDIKTDTIYRPDSQYKISGTKIQEMFPSHQMETFENAIKYTTDYLANLQPVHNGRS